MPSITIRDISGRGDEVGGQRILRVGDSGTSCFVRDDMLLFFPDTYTTWVLRSELAP